MGLKNKSTINVPNIEIKLDENKEFEADRILRKWGSSIPILKINDFVVNIDLINSVDIHVNANQITNFSININDKTNFVKDGLKINEFNTVVIFLGNKKFNKKFEGLIINTNNNITKNKNTITLNGYIFPKKLFETKQSKYDEKTVSEIISEICNEIGIGYFSNDNSSLDLKIPEIINPNMDNYSFIKYLLKKFTNNIYSLDDNYILHVGNLESMINKDLSKINYFESYKLPKEIDLKISNKIVKNQIEDDNKTPKEIDDDFLKNIEYLKFTTFHIDDNKNMILNKSYKMYDENSEEFVNYNNDFGIGDYTENYFSEFKGKVFGSKYVEIINKQFGGKIITVEMVNTIFEIAPFITLFMDLYTWDKEQTTKQKLKEQGKKILIGYSYHYTKNLGKIKQKLKLI